MTQPIIQARPFQYQPKFGSTASAAVSSVSIQGKSDEEIVKRLKNESPHTSYQEGIGTISRGCYGESHSIQQLENAYHAYVGDAQGVTKMFEDLYSNYPKDAPQALVNAITSRYIVLDSQGASHRGLGKVNLKLHPIVAQVSMLYHSDLGRCGYRYEDKEQAKEAFPILFQVMDMPDKARAAKILKEAYGMYQGCDAFSKIVDKFITDVLPKRGNA
ncbi:MAG: hypothetical protein K2X66_09900 [Cyanobacteria bacterium]|nr:hypothetical protein [Cyanobacteriota bacterium]